MKSWILLLYSLTVASAVGSLRLTSGQVELSSNLNDGSTCPNQPVRVQCKACSSSLQSWTFSSFIPENDPVTFDSTSEVEIPVIRNNGLMIKAVATEIIEVTTKVANITSTLSFQATSAVDGKTVLCISDTGYNDSLSILVTDAVILPADFSCTSTAVNCEQSRVLYQCMWSQVIDSFNFTVSDSDGDIVQEMMFQNENDKNVEFSVACNSVATVTVDAFRTCNTSTQSLADARHLSANCSAVCMNGMDDTRVISAGAIAGIVIGTITTAIIIVIIIVIVSLRKRKYTSYYCERFDNENDQSEDTSRKPGVDNEDDKTEVDSALEDALNELHDDLFSQGRKLGIDDKDIADTFSKLSEILKTYGTKKTDPELEKEKGRKSMFIHLSSLLLNGLSNEDKTKLKFIGENHISFPLLSLEDAVRARYPGHIAGRGTHTLSKSDKDTILEAIVRCKWTSNTSLNCSCECCKCSK